VIEIVRALAPNPGPFTGSGTNTYLVGDGRNVVVIDPGPVIESHADAVVAALGDAEPRAVVVTHTHPDHAPAANPLAQRLGVPAMGHSPGPEFSPDVTLGDGDNVNARTFSLVAVHTPGHTADHLCYLVGGALFTGDHIMGGSTVVIEDAAAYMRSLRRVLELAPARLLPGHGDELLDAVTAVQEYIAHREARERQILAAVERGAHTLTGITAVVYAGIEPTLRPAARRQVAVQLEKLAAEGRVRLLPDGADPTGMIAVPGETP